MNLRERELATVLAALRGRQHRLDHEAEDGFSVDDVATDGGRIEPLTPQEIDALCERLNVADKPRMRLVVEMYGGCIEGVHTDSDAVEITDVVFLEDARYGYETTDDEFVVNGGPWDGKIIFTHHGDTQVNEPAEFEHVMQVAQARIGAAEQED